MFYAKPIEAKAGKSGISISYNAKNECYRISFTKLGQEKLTGGLVNELKQGVTLSLNDDPATHKIATLRFVDKADENAIPIFRTASDGIYIKAKCWRTPPPPSTHNSEELEIRKVEDGAVTITLPIWASPKAANFSSTDRGE